jgi:uncharacterized linocin/CFP29 family protein
VAAPAEGVIAELRDTKPLVRLRIPFTVAREDVDDIERGAQDSNWDPVKAAAKKLAFSERRDHLGSRDRRCIRVVHAWRRFRSAPWH